MFQCIGPGWQQQISTFMFISTCKASFLFFLRLAGDGDFTQVLYHWTYFVRVLFPLSPLATRSREERGRMGNRKLCRTHEQEWRQRSGRRILVNQLNFIAEYKEYVGFGSLGSNPNFP